MAKESRNLDDLPADWSDAQTEMLDPRRLLTDLTQSRAKTSAATVDEYRELYVAGGPGALPPLKVCRDGKHYRLIGGHHRHEAACAADLPTVPCLVRDGNLEIAQFEACRENITHGLRRSRDDKRCAVKMALANPLTADWSSNRIAEHCGVSDDLVNAVRDEIESQLSETKVETARPARALVGRDGKRRKAKKRRKRSADASERLDAARRMLNTTEQPKGATASAPSDDFDPATLAAAPGKISGGTAFDVAEIEAASGEADGDQLAKMAAPFKHWHRELGKCLREFERIASDEKMGAHLGNQIARIKHDLTSVRDTIRCHTPEQICPSCNGKGCSTCTQTGFWTWSLCQSRKEVG